MRKDECNIDNIREKRKKQLRKWAVIDKVKGFFVWIIAAVFWIGVVITFIGGCLGTFIKSSDEPQDDYEEYIHSIIP